MPSSAFSAIVLTAGRSSRMGREKALLETRERDGRVLWQRQRGVLAEAGAGEIFLSARAEQTWTLMAEGFAAVLHDEVPDAGPLAGIAAGLRRASHPHLAVLAIDLPRIGAEWFAALRAEGSTGVGAVGRRDGFFEPLAAIYPVRIEKLVTAALARRELSLQRLLTRAVDEGLMRVREIGADEAGQFENWNEPV
jgi:molybdopterin-guanine dinucleotide biosynthesis protein A